MPQETTGTSLFEAICSTHDGRTDLPSNLVISPLSIYTALDIVRSGVTGESHQALAAFIGDTVVPRSYPGLVNAVFYSSVTADFFSAAASRFNAHLEPYESEVQANRWVNEATNGRITELVQGLRDVDIIVCNAIYFRQDWAFPFAPRDSFDDYLYLEGTKVKQRFMARKAVKGYYQEFEGIKYLGLKYSNGTLLVVALSCSPVPRYDNVQELAQHPDTIDVVLPRFRVETSLDLQEGVERLGLGSLFKQSADFMPMTGTAPTAVTKIVHKAVIEVDEQGTAASAATAVVISRSFRPAKRPAKRFVANTPFRFYVYDPVEQVVLFEGVFRGERTRAKASESVR